MHVVAPPDLGAEIQCYFAYFPVPEHMKRYTRKSNRAKHPRRGIHRNRASGLISRITGP